MGKYILKRVLMAIVTLLVIVCTMFLLLRFMPGSPFDDEMLTEKQVAIMMEAYGLDQPFYIQFLNYVGNMLKGDLGISFNIQAGMPITTLIGARLPLTIQIGLQAAALGSLIGMIFGIVAALHRNTLFDSAATALSVVGVSLPSFVFALVLQYFLAFKLKWFPVLYSDKQSFLSTILPTISLSMFTMASIARYSRSELIEVMASDYILLAEAKGLPRGKLILRHAIRNTLIGVITVLAPLVVSLMTGSLVVEQAFSIPGIGSLFVTAIQSNDYNVVVSISFIYSVMLVTVMLLVDILYGIIDPRIRLAKGA